MSALGHNFPAPSPAPSSAPHSSSTQPRGHTCSGIWKRRSHSGLWAQTPSCSDQLGKLSQPSLRAPVSLCRWPCQSQGGVTHQLHTVGTHTGQSPADVLFPPPWSPALLPLCPFPTLPLRVPSAMGSGWWLCLSNLGPCLRRGSNNSSRNCPNYCCPFEHDICLMMADGNLTQAVGTVWPGEQSP